MRELNNRFLERTEIRPNRIVFHDAETIREMLGVGTLLKELKVADRRPKKTDSLTPAAAAPASSLSPAEGERAGVRGPTIATDQPIS